MRPLVRSVTRLLAKFAPRSIERILGIDILVAAVFLPVSSLDTSCGELRSNLAQTISVLPYADQITVSINRNYNDVIASGITVIRLELRAVRETESAYSEVDPFIFDWFLCFCGVCE